MQKQKLIFIVGPTAVGKTEAAVILAQRLNAEIISCDSMQIYKGMDIITSKPAAALRRKVKHHLIGIIGPDREYNVSKFKREALKKIKEILKKGKTPILVGGTGLYMSILIDGIFKTKAQNKNIRERFYNQAKLMGSDYLYEKLKNVDPQAAAKIHPHDAKRIIRALEVFEITGKPISELQKLKEGLSASYDIKIFCLNMEREKLKKRINERVEKMFSKGAVNEVKKLVRRKLSKTAVSAIGIKELKGYLDGAYDLNEASRLIKRNTRAYAKRQLTWFRKDKRIKWFDLKDTETSKDIAQKIWKELC